MRLIKAAAYALLGYFLYELVLGMTEGHESLGMARSGNAHSSGRQRNENSRHRSESPRPRMSGAGIGQEVEAQDADGATARTVVGRGVVKR